MQNQKDNFAASDENTILKFSAISVLGDREDQQDSLGYDLGPNEALVIVCDGMGGHEGGKTASALAVNTFLKTFDEKYPVSEIHQMLVDTANTADGKISAMTRENGTKMQSGTTLISVFIQEKQLYWVSAGDSRIYIYRDGELVQATNDHIFKHLLEERLSAGEISREEYAAQICRGEALVSFLGVGGLPQIDANETAFELRENDKILLTTDGLYKLVSDEEIARILDNFTNISDALNALNSKAKRIAKNKNVRRDNMTVSLIQIK